MQKRMTHPKRLTKMQRLAKKLLSTRTRSDAVWVLQDMVDLSSAKHGLPYEDLEETYLGLRDDENEGTRTTTMKDVRKLAKYYLRG